MKKSVAYYRSSTDLQENSVKMQRNKAFEYCVTHHLMLDDEYKDEFVSARKLSVNERPELSRLIQDIKEDQIGKLILFKRDRLSRKADEYLDIFLLFKKKNIEVHFTSKNEYPMVYTKMGEFIELIMGGLCEHEGNQILERILESKKVNFKEGKDLGNLPYGYEKVKNEYKFIPHEVKIVDQIFHLFIEEDFEDMKSFKLKVDQLGIRKRGKPWKMSELINSLSQPMYKGLRIRNFGEEQVQKEFKELSIIDPLVWNLSQYYLSLRYQPRKKNEKLQIVYMLENTVRCKYCNDFLNGKQRMSNYEPVFYYECNKHNIRINKNNLEYKIIEKLKEFFSYLVNEHTTELFQRYQKNNIKKIGRILKKKMNQIEQKERVLLVHVDDWINANTTFRKSKLNDAIMLTETELENEYEHKQEILKKRYELLELPNEIQDFLDSLSVEKMLNELNEKQVKSLFGNLIETIYVDQFSVEIIFKHPYITVHEVNSYASE